MRAFVALLALGPFSSCLLVLNVPAGKTVIDPTTGIVVPDTTAPDPVTSVTHSAGNASLAASPLLTWTGGGTDTGGSGFDHFEYSLGTSAGGTQTLTWTPVGALTSTTASGLTLTSGTTYYANVRAVDGAGNISTVTSSTGWIATDVASQLAFTASPSGSTQAGTNFSTQPIVEVRDAVGTVVGSYATGITLQAHSAAGCGSASTSAIQATTNPVIPSSGVATFAGVNHRKVESLYIKASSGAMTACIGPLTITPGPPSKLGFLTSNAAWTVGTTYSVNPQVAVQDQYGNTVPSASDTITLWRAGDSDQAWVVPNSGTYYQRSYSFTSSGAFAQSTSSGVATFSGLANNQVGWSFGPNGNFALMAFSAAGYTWVGSGNFTVTGGAPNKILVLGKTSVVPGLCTGPITVAIADSYHNSANSGSARTITLTGKAAGDFYTDATCGTTSSGVLAFATNESTKSVWYKTAATSGGLTFSASVTSGAALTAGSNALTIAAPSDIALGSGVLCAVGSGALHCWGSSGAYQLGYGANTSVGGFMDPVVVPGAESGITDVSVGSDHTCAVQSGAAVCWGNGGNGRLGGLDGRNTRHPVPVTGLTSGVTKVSAGNATTCAIQSGALYCWGAGAGGLLGNGTLTDSLTPVAVTGLGSGVTDISVGSSVACAVQSGAVKCWGAQEDGGLGNGSTSVATVSSPVQVTGLTAGATNVSVSFGIMHPMWKTHACAVVSGAAKCWGINLYGQLGDGTYTTRSTPVDPTGLTTGVTQVSVSAGTACAVMSGAPYCWGGNVTGQVGSGSASTQRVTTPTAVSSPGWGTVTKVVVSRPVGYLDGSSSSLFVCALAETMYCWGEDRTTSGSGYHVMRGVFGNSTTLYSTAFTPRISPALTSVTGVTRDCVVESGAVKCWAGNYYIWAGFLGAAGGHHNTASSVPVTMTGMTSGYTKVDRGYYTLCGLTGTDIYCRGSGYTSLFSDAPVKQTGLGPVSDFTAGSWYTCAVSGGAAYCWGKNVGGELGDGSLVDRASPTLVSGLGSGVTAIATEETFGNAGDAYGATCAIQNGGVFCWGNNNAGQLGDGTTTRRLVPVPAIGLSSGVTQIFTPYAAGIGSTFCAVKSGAVYCWGYGGGGLIGDGGGVSRSVPTLVTGLASGVTAVGYGPCARMDTGALKCWGPGASGATSPTDVPGMTSGVDSVVFGPNGTMMGGAFYVWGGYSGGHPPYAGIRLSPVVRDTTW